ncbi:MAG: hypothetical protein R6W31_10690 [Bacteroidales bacterium]
MKYILTGEVVTIIEYLDITRNDDEIVYTATVPEQNQGNGIHFIQTRSDGTFTFENPDHDFPQKIDYQMLTDTELMVKVSGGNQEGFAYVLNKQVEKATQKDTTTTNPDFDIALAKKLGADDYGMKSYILVILKTGSNQTTDTAFISNCFRGHLDNIDRLAKEGKMIVAGPVGNNIKTYRGIFILNLTSVEEAERILQTDPAIKEKLLEVELYNWYGSAALPEYLKYDEKIWKIKPF